ncbi:MliC family protein [Neorhizobium sp. T786]|uniref:MliC family protein n=1 Tax=Pseudorhizobium xiangyangii TaxID=2883104 RepID=UPI001CFF9A68|nr:MliC family protein [Neorhizobium xiangyangii]MCB5202332.1 MliC family protein [Neorhizobium xiangyangii]
MMRMMLPGAVLAGVLGLALSAGAEDIRIELPADTRVETVRAEYECGGQRVSAQYINAGSVSLAVLAMGEDVVVAANVMAASGAKYDGGRYVWWTKGREATLYDLRMGEADPGVSCTPSG